MKQLNESDIEYKTIACVYCYTEYPVEPNWRGCCGECHFEDAYVTKWDSLYLESEVEILKDEVEQ